MAKKNEEAETKATMVAKKTTRTRKEAAIEFTPVTPRRAARINANPYATANIAPTPYKMTPAAQKAAGVKRPTTLRTTRLKTDVGLTAFPSPTNLIPKPKPKSILKGRKTRAQAIQEDMNESLSGDVETSISSAIQALTVRGRKVKKNEGKEEAISEDKSDSDDDSLPIRRGRRGGGKQSEAKEAVKAQGDKTSSIEPAITKPAKQVTRARSRAAGTEGDMSETYEDTEMEPFDLSPVVPLSLRPKILSNQDSKTSHENLVSETESDPDETTKLSQDEQETIQKLIVKVQTSAVSAYEKQLWVIEEEDLKRIQVEIDKLKAETSAKSKTVAVQLLQGMLDVTLRFQEFRESYDKFLDDADKVGMVLDWGERNEGGSDTEELGDQEEEDDADF